MYWCSILFEISYTLYPSNTTFNVEKYAEALMELASDNELRKKYGREGRKRVKENFLYKQYSEHIRNTVKEIINIW